MPEVSIIIVNWNTRELTGGCLDSIERHAGDVEIEIIVVDNASRDGSPEWLRENYPHVKLIENRENVGFARANNQGAACAQGDYLLLLNSDALLTGGALQALLDTARANGRAGVVGARLTNPDGSFQASYTGIPTLWREFLILSGLGRLLIHPRYPSQGPDSDHGSKQVGYVEGACMLAPRQAYLAAGGLDEGYFMYAEDVDLCFAMQRQGWQVWYQPRAEVVHIGGASSMNRKPQREGDLYRSRVRFFRKYYGSGQAWVLKMMIYFFTAVKNLAHGVLRWASGGRLGRPVVSLHQLAAKLEEKA